jgi:uncharacterized membrane protein YecN with MAPEG domain
MAERFVLVSFLARNQARVFVLLFITIILAYVRNIHRNGTLTVMRRERNFIILITFFIYLIELKNSCLIIQIESINGNEYIYI